MKITPENVDDIVTIISKTHRCFGGGNLTVGNPISHALKDSPPQFAAGVDVKEVVEHVLELAEEYDIKILRNIA